MACKPGSVPLRVMTIHLGRPLLDGSSNLPARLGTENPLFSARENAPRLFGLAPGEVCLAMLVTKHAVGSYPTFSPLPRHSLKGDGGRFVSVALSLGLHPAGVTRHRFLWSPDFPRDEIELL